MTGDPRAVVDGDVSDPRAVAAGFAAEIFGNRMTRETFDAAARVGSGGGVSVAAKVVGLLLASPEFQSR